MEVKDLFDPAVKQDILNRVNKLTPESKNQWGKMNASQMLAHCCVPLGVAEGKNKLKRSFMGFVFGRMARPMLYNEKPFKRGLPTDGSFIVKDPRDFNTEKQNLVGRINDFREDTLVGEKHPFFGKLTKEQWSKGMYKHLDHHLQQFGV
ncbi:MAG TPA: DUF1569 domain-containing protein [Chitinophagaceae bacterium]|nr:DUF1569 domain-containing protein [Chitinophagaceae bacterium]